MFPLLSNLRFEIIYYASTTSSVCEALRYLHLVCQLIRLSQALTLVYGLSSGLFSKPTLQNVALDCELLSVQLSVSVLVS